MHPDHRVIYLPLMSTYLVSGKLNKSCFNSASSYQGLEKLIYIVFNFWKFFETWNQSFINNLI